MEMLDYAFMQRALAAGLVVGVICSLVAVFVVLKRLAFAGIGISHSALGGVGIGAFLGINPVIAGGIFATLIAWLVGIISLRKQLHEDTAIGIFFSASMALGTVLLNVSSGYYGDIFSFLFGNILAVSVTDLWLICLLGAAVFLFLTLFFKELLFISFDEDVARAAGLPVNFIYFGLLTVIALTVVVCVKVVGIVLTAALLIIPAATGQRVAQDVRGLVFFSLLTGMASSLGGLMLSYNYNLPSGATIVLCATALFLLSATVHPLSVLWRKIGTRDRTAHKTGAVRRH